MLVPSMIAVASSLAANAVLPGQHRVESVIAHGRTTTVYRVRARDGTPRAAQVLHADYIDELGRWFVESAQLRANIDHPHLPKTFVVDHLPSGEPVEVYELLTGRSARVMLDRQPRGLHLPEVARVVTALGMALDHMHQRARPVLHRSLMPEHVFIRLRDSAVLLTDTGIADRPRFQGTRASYQSPEEISGGTPVSARSDIFSLASLAFELLTATPAFAGAHDVVAEGPGRRLPSANAARPEVPAPIDRVLARAWSLHPEQRPPSAGDFASALGAALRGEGFPVGDSVDRPTQEVPVVSVARRTRARVLSDPQVPSPPDATLPSPGVETPGARAPFRAPPPRAAGRSRERDTVQTAPPRRQGSDTLVDAPAIKMPARPVGKPRVPVPLPLPTEPDPPAAPAAPARAAPTPPEVAPLAPLATAEVTGLRGNTQLMFREGTGEVPVVPLTAATRSSRPPTEDTSPSTFLPDATPTGVVSPPGEIRRPEAAVRILSGAQTVQSPRLEEPSAEQVPAGVRTAPMASAVRPETIAPAEPVVEPRPTAPIPPVALAAPSQPVVVSAAPTAPDPVFDDRPDPFTLATTPSPNARRSPNPAQWALPPAAPDALAERSRIDRDDTQVLPTLPGTPWHKAPVAMAGLFIAIAIIVVGLAHAAGVIVGILRRPQATEVTRCAPCPRCPGATSSP